MHELSILRLSTNEEMAEAPLSQENDFHEAVMGEDDCQERQSEEQQQPRHHQQPQEEQSAVECRALTLWTPVLGSAADLRRALAAAWSRERQPTGHGQAAQLCEKLVLHAALKEHLQNASTPPPAPQLLLLEAPPAKAETAVAMPEDEPERSREGQGWMAVSEEPPLLDVMAED